MSIFAKMGEAAKKLFIPPEKNPEMVSPYQRSLMNPTMRSQPQLLNDEAPKPQGQKEVHFLNPALDEHRDITRDKHGKYVQTLSYPLPPVKWEGKQHDQNRRMRNSKNRFLE